jgi:hypothetical protein
MTKQKQMIEKELDQVSGGGYRHDECNWHDGKPHPESVIDRQTYAEYKFWSAVACADLDIDDLPAPYTPPAPGK